MTDLNPWKSLTFKWCPDIIMISSSSAKRPKIKPPKRLNSQEIDFESNWGTLEKAIRQILTKDSSSLSFEELYRKSYNLVLRKYGKALYENVCCTIEDHLKYRVRSELLQQEHLLDMLIKKWEDHLLGMRMISDVLMYLDRVYSKELHLPLIYDVGLTQFKESVIKSHDNELGKRAITLLISELAKLRSGRVVNKFYIKSTISMFESLAEDSDPTKGGDDYYMRFFEPVFLKESEKHFSELISDLMPEKSGTLYLNNVMQLIQDEESRNQLFLPDQTYTKLVDIMDNVLIATNFSTFLENESDGLHSWVLNNDYEKLTKTFKLNQRIDTNYQILNYHLYRVICTHEQELQLTQSEAKDKKNLTQLAIQWVEKIIALKLKYDTILVTSFSNSTMVRKTVENALSDLINKNYRSAEYLSLFVDHSIKHMTKVQTEQDLEKMLDNCVEIFRFLKDKDLFERYYKNHLGKRLLTSKSINNDLELIFINKLKVEIGSSFTLRFEGMFRDIRFSKGLVTEFKGTAFEPGIELESNVLTKTFWPMPFTNIEVSYPVELQEAKEAFEQFYQTKFSGRNLTWCPNFGNVDMRVRLSKRNYEVNMPTYSALIVLLFVEDPSRILTFEEVSSLTEIPQNDLKRHLQSLSVAPRTRLLTKKPMSKEINPGDVFAVNEEFHSKQAKFKVLTVSASSSNKAENDAERKKTLQELDSSRHLEIDAAAIRIMKSRKNMKHNELISEIIKQLAARFKPSVSMMKQRVGGLIEKEYLARDPDDNDVYSYIA